MTVLTKLGKPECREISHQALVALETLENELGLKIERVGNGTFDPDSYFEFKLRFTLAGADPGKKDFDRYADLFGLKPEDYGRTFVTRGETYQITGISPNRPKYPINAKSVRTGKSFKFQEASVQRALGITPTALGAPVDIDALLRYHAGK